MNSSPIPERVAERLPDPVPARPSTAEAALRVRAARTELIAQRQASVLSLLGELLDEATLQRALDAFAGALQMRFSATRAAVALCDDAGALQLAAISQRTLVDAGAVEVQRLLDAMDEALTQERTIRFPMSEQGAGTLAAHRRLLDGRARTTLLSVPLYRNDEPFGALLLERIEGEPFAKHAIGALEQIALLAAPLLHHRCKAERSAVRRLRDALSDALRQRLRRDRLGLPLLLGTLATALLLGLTIPVDRPVRASAELVPHERRLVTAPVGGFVDQVLVGAGERVEPDQLLARLDGRELALEAAREDSEVRAAETELRAAMASHDRQASAVARARLARERADRALVAHRLARGELRAPIAGLITSGDPLDAVGAPVARGDTLFEIVPDHGYAVHLLVAAADIREVAVGQRGELTLQARPGERLALTVHSIHPVAENEGGQNRFRVRADLNEPSPAVLRPGESGTARLVVGRTNLLARAMRPIRQRVSELRWRWFG